MDYSYKEVDKALENRISAHAKYSDFNLHDWLSKNFSIKPSDNILDLGCGDGNFINLFWNAIKPDGMLHGIDINEDLIKIAKKKYQSISTNISLDVANYDDFNPLGKMYDWIFSIYSIYYTQNPEDLIHNLFKSMSSGGKFVVTGPSSQNALELDEINLAVTGKKRNKEDIRRMHRIEEDFLSVFTKIFSKDKTSLEFINTKMSFPTSEEFAIYYWSTLLWRESITGLNNKEISALKSKTVEVIEQMPDSVLNKQMSCLVGIK